MTNDTKRLGELPLGKLLWQFSFPATIGMIVNAIYNIVDRIFVGQAVGEDALAALSFAFPFMTAIMAVAMLVGLGGTSIFAISLGEGNTDRAKKILANVFVFAGLLEVIISIIGHIYLKPLLVAFGTPEGQIMDYAVSYMRIVLSGSMFQGIGFALNAIIRSDGNPKMAMISMLAGAITNILFDWLFTMVFPFGVVGVAVATVMGQLATMIWTIYYFTNRSNVRLSFKGFRADFPLMGRIMLIGLSPALVQLAMATVNIIYNNSLVHYGDSIAVSAFSVYNSAMTIAIMPIFGINQGVQPIVGYNYGAQKFDRVRKAMLLGIIWATVVSMLGLSLIRLFPEQIVRAFNKSPQLIELGVKALNTNSLALPLVGSQIICSNYFQYINKPKAATFLSLSRQCLFLIPALLILPKMYGLDGIFYAQPLSDVLAFTVSVISCAVAMKKLGRKL